MTESFKDLVNSYPPSNRDIREKEEFLIDIDLSELLNMGKRKIKTGSRISKKVRLDNIPYGVKIKTKCGAIVMLDKKSTI